MTGFKELNLKISYDSDQDDILNDFYIPVLSHSKRYYRLAGFFSSSSLSLAAAGITGLIANDGEMKIVVSVRLSKDDVEAINKGSKSPQSAIEDAMINDMESLEEGLVKNRLKALAYLVAKGKLEIKVAVLTNQKGEPLSSESAQYNIFHQKVGIAVDERGDTIAFNGSLNESSGGWISNVEEFNVFRSWVDGEVPHLKASVDKFERFWLGNTRRALILDVPEAVRRSLIKMAPIDSAELFIENGKIGKRISLRDYQQRAISGWLREGKRGIFEMATGTGKTITALSCLEKVIGGEKSIAVVITAPFKHLVRQWAQEMENLGLGRPIEIHGEVQEWRGVLRDSILDYNNGRKGSLYMITTHETFSKKDFIESIKIVKGNILLIADEMHALGAPTRTGGLIDRYDFRLGLSATPHRWFDEPGTNALMDYFGKVVFEFTLKDAINSINPETGQTYLTPYEYLPHFVELSQGEMEEYRKISRLIGIRLSNEDDDGKKKEIVDLLRIKRKRIITNAIEKYAEFNKIIDGIEEKELCLVYCSPRQIGKVQGMLLNKGIIQRKFTASESLKERTRALRDFSSGECQILVAMKCLDEGVDVPAARIAIFLASSENPREFIQRRGRILRRFPGKEKATIHDIIVVPSLKGPIDHSILEIERGILQKEMKRYKEFAEASANYGRAFNLFLPILDRYKVSFE